MTRLFIAVEIPDSIKIELARLEPKGDAIRVQHQPHITIHFIGNVSDQMALAISSELNSIDVMSYNQNVEGVGAFTNRKSRHILWAGVSKCDGLMKLHAVVGASLIKLGLTLEDRDYTPHITLARLDRRSRAMIEPFVSDNYRFKTRFSVSRFCLYSSENLKGKASYRKLQEYKLGT